VCGSRDGQPLVQEALALASRSAWFAACSRNSDGAHLYAYGPDYSPGICYDPVARAAYDGGSEMAPAGSHPGCEGGYPGLFDLAGSLAEWEDGCQTGGDAGVRCPIRGGAYYHANEYNFRCEAVDLPAEDYRNSGVGIRCCSDLE
jgi:formylglycine-generating enzyme